MPEPIQRQRSTREGKTISTPTTNAKLPFRRGGFETLTDGLDYAADGETGINFFDVRGALTEALSYRDLHGQALVLARQLGQLALPRHARFAIVAETSPDFFRFFFACQYAGLLPVPVPMPFTLGGKDAYLRQTGGMIEAAGTSALVSPPALLDLLREAAPGLDMAMAATPADFHALPEGPTPEPLGRDDISYIQYSSGSTSAPKGVVISQCAVNANVDGIIRHVLDAVPGDRCASWLPLYHDMGLVGFGLSPMLSQVSVDLISTHDFARRAMTWLHLISNNGATITYSPSLGYDLCARRAASAPSAADGLDLSRLRAAGIGGDMVRADVLNQFSEVFAPSGFRPTAYLPSYGMAEFTVGISFAPCDRPLATDRIDMAILEQTGDAVPVPETEAAADNGRVFVKCGVPLPGHDMEVRDGQGQALGERKVGRITVKGPSASSGYFRDPEATALAWDADGWLDTGDLGYWADGEIVVTGRSKDLILSNGRNIWPQDIEWAVEDAHGLRTHDVAAFSIDDGQTESVVVLVQCRLHDSAERQQLRDDVAASVRQSAGIDCLVVLVPHRGLPLTSSGKLSRAGAKRNYLAGQYAESDAPLPDAAVQ